MITYRALEGLYALHDELGSGGFGKVRLATHLLTSQKVAIKIIDKFSLPKSEWRRVENEVEALKTLSHQNICRIYQFIETPFKFFIVMEYCSGGELFDYIIKKARLEESEARHFFRQLVQAVAYVHSMGYAHRDLKPENLLLTEDLQLKLIDFGLCARPKYGLDNYLRTCCGSAAYAAPELVQGKRYKGNQADVWSMGVLLYTLLCGTLPFDGGRVELIYAKIVAGKYLEPDYLSPLSKDLLRSLLQVNPEKRITVPQLIVHPWINKKYTQTLKWRSVYDRGIIDKDVIVELSSHFGRSVAEMETHVRQFKFDYLTATYYILLQQKHRGMHFTLPLRRPSDASANPIQAILGSPTIHASLENDLDHSGMDELELLDSEKEASNKSAEGDSATSLPTSQQDKNLSYALAVLSMPTTHTGSSPKQSGACGIRKEAESVITPIQQDFKTQFGTGVRTQFYHRPDRNKENIRPSTVRVRGPVRLNDERPISSVCDSPHLPIVSTPDAKIRSQSTGRDEKLQHTPVHGTTTPNARTPRSSWKTPRLRQRVFASLERQADRMITLLTPRKVKNMQPQVLKQTKTMVNVSITSSKSPEVVRRELTHVFAEQDISIEQHGWKISGRKEDEHGRVMTVELEVVWIEMGNKERLVGVKRKRLNGDAFMYKRVCEQVLQLAGL